MDPLALAPRGVPQGSPKRRTGQVTPVCPRSSLSCVWDGIHREGHLKGGNRGTDGHLRKCTPPCSSCDPCGVSGGNYRYWRSDMRQYCRHRPGPAVPQGGRSGPARPMSRGQRCMGSMGGALQLTPLGPRQTLSTLILAQLVSFCEMGGIVVLCPIVSLPARKRWSEESGSGPGLGAGGPWCSVITQRLI